MENENMELMDMENENVDMTDVDSEDIETEGNNALVAGIACAVGIGLGLAIAKVAKPIGQKLKERKSNPKKEKKCGLFRRKKNDHVEDVDFEMVDDNDSESEENSEE